MIITLPMLVGNEHIADALTARLSSSIHTRVEVHARAVSTVNDRFVKRFVKNLKDAGVTHMVLRGANQELYDLFKIGTYLAGIVFIASAPPPPPKNFLPNPKAPWRF